MALREKNVGYMPNDIKLIHMEQKPELIILKKYAICDIVTGDHYVSSPITSRIVFYGTLLLEEIGLNLGDYPSEFLPDLGLVSPTLSKEIKDFNSYAQLDAIKRYLTGSANEIVKEKIARLMYELMNCEHSKYNPDEYLGAVANLQYLMSNNKDGLDDEALLETLESSTQFYIRSGNEIAIKSARRFTHK